LSLASPVRFQDFDGNARITLAGALAALVGFVLPWVTLRLNLQVLDLNGTALAAAPLVFARIGTPAGPLEVALVAIAAGLAMVCAIANLLLILAPGLSTLRGLNHRAGQRLSIVGAVAVATALLLMAAVVGPQVGVTAITYGAVLSLAGLALSAYAWPKARRLGDEDEDEDEHDAPGAGAPPPPAA
jgi:hypothetical protein